MALGTLYKEVKPMGLNSLNERQVSEGLLDEAAQCVHVGGEHT